MSRAATVMAFHPAPLAAGRGMGMRVRVTLPQGREVSWEGFYRHSFDAYDDALARHLDADRVEVRCLQGAELAALLAQADAAAATSTTTTTTH